jgi:predicted AAA+ superfamily ATPase
MWHRGAEPQIYCWRTATGVEVGIVVETRGRIEPMEVKLSATPRPAMAAGILALRQALGEKIEPGYVIHPGEVRLPLAPGAQTVPFAEW